MKPGTKPKTIRAQIAAGDPRRRGKQTLERLLAGEPRPSQGLPDCPEYLQGRARDAWTFWSQELVAMDIDRRPDGPMLAGCCIAFEAVIESYETIKKQGRFIAKKALNPTTNTLVIVDIRPHPAVRMGNQSMALLRLFCAEFGLSPVSRVRLAVAKDDSGDDEDLLALLRQPRIKRPPPIIVN